MIFDGKLFAEKKETDLKVQVDGLKKRGTIPKLVVVRADNSRETELYVSLKQKFAERIGVLFDVHRFEEGQTRLIVEDIQKANQDSSVHGIMVQLPVRDEQIIVKTILPRKDIDCLTPESLGLVLSGRPGFLPATVKAVLEVIQSQETRLTGKDICILGASIIVGKPLAILLSDLGATVTLCRSTTKDLSYHTRQADILISATGAAELIHREMVKEGAMVIDVGISKLLRDGKFRVVGDVNIDVLAKTSFLTPVPGGVGPVTVACLFENLLQAI